MVYAARFHARPPVVCCTFVCCPSRVCLCDLWLVVQPIDPQSPRSFVQFILEPFYKMVAQAVGEHPRDVEAMFDKLGVKVRRVPQWLVVGTVSGCAGAALGRNVVSCAALVTAWCAVLRQLKPQVYHWDSKPLLKTALHQFFGRFGFGPRFGPADRCALVAAHGAL